MLNTRPVSLRPLRSALFTGLLIAVVSLPAVAASNPWSKDQLLAPEALKARLATSSKAKPLIICVGFKLLFDGAHVPGAEFYGPAARPEGIADLKKKLEPLPRNKEIILYCGCCPVEECPNIRPAFEVARKMGFTHLEVLDLPTSFVKDWVDKGYPIEKSN